MAKILIAKIADPESKGLRFSSTVLHGWSDTFVLLYIAVVCSVVLMGLVAVKEEKTLRSQQKAAS